VPARRELGPQTDWRDAFAGVQAVVHLAAVAHERAMACERARDYETLRRVNVLGTERLAREAAAAGVRHFVFASSIGVCGDETRGAPFTETSAPAPRSLYARSKLEAEHALAAVSASSGLAVTLLRPTLIYGPGNGGNFLRLLRAVESAWPLPLAAIRNRRNLAYVDNVVSAIVAALARPEATGPLVVCDAEAVSTADLVARLAHAMGRPARLFALPPGVLLAAGRVLGKSDMVRRLVASLEADCGKARRVLGWQPRVSASEGLARTAAWYRGQAEKKHVEASG
jgi:nucleoside-diphosphate-sugar epimerase